MPSMHLQIDGAVKQRTLIGLLRSGEIGWTSSCTRARGASQLWLTLDTDGQLGRREIAGLLLMLGRVAETTSHAAQVALRPAPLNDSRVGMARGCEVAGSAHLVLAQPVAVPAGKAHPRHRQEHEAGHAAEHLRIDRMHIARRTVAG